MFIIIIIIIIIMYRFFKTGILMQQRKCSTFKQVQEYQLALTS